MGGWKFRAVFLGAGLSAVALLLVAGIWYLQNLQGGAEPDATQTITEEAQNERNKAFTVVNTITVKKIETLEVRADVLSAKIVALDPLRAPSTKPLLANRVSETRERFDPGPSAYEVSKQDRRTSSGISSRALQAYSQETGISASRIEALMQQ